MQGKVNWKYRLCCDCDWSARAYLIGVGGKVGAHVANPIALPPARQPHKLMR